MLNMDRTPCFMAPDRGLVPRYNHSHRWLLVHVKAFINAAYSPYSAYKIFLMLVVCEQLRTCRHLGISLLLLLPINSIL
ncbi:hypothetical protein, partial [Pseudomonas paraeruginosa]|uniref:hypothetical protein n=1 Tax=Pseudomonas paraeruginosa TaxID=2994495 RepID=UPI003A4C8389